MIAALITFLGIVVIVASGWGSVTAWIAVVIIALVLFTRMVWIDDAKARNNCVDYWANGGHERRRR